MLGCSDDATVIASVLKLMRPYVADAHRAKARERLSLGWVRESDDATGDAADSDLESVNCANANVKPWLMRHRCYGKYMGHCR